MQPYDISHEQNAKRKIGWKVFEDFGMKSGIRFPISVLCVYALKGKRTMHAKSTQRVTYKEMCTAHDLVQCQFLSAIIYHLAIISMQRKHHVHAHQPQRSSHFHCLIACSLVVGYFVFIVFGFYPRKGVQIQTRRTHALTNWCKCMYIDRPTNRQTTHFHFISAIQQFCHQKITKNDAKASGISLSESVCQSTSHWVSEYVRCAHSISFHFDYI